MSVHETLIVSLSSMEQNSKVKVFFGIQLGPLSSIQTKAEQSWFVKNKKHQKCLQKQEQSKDKEIIKMK